MMYDIHRLAKIYIFKPLAIYFYMLTLNLISNEQKKEIKMKRLYEFLKKIFCVLLILTCLMAIVFLSAELILRDEFADTVQQTSLVTINSRGFDVKISNINHQVNTASSIQKNYTAWPPLIKEIAAKTPADIKLDSLAINGDKKTIQLKGAAKYRENLLEFKKQLEDSGKYKNIALPLQNILQKENVSFDISIELNDINK